MTSEKIVGLILAAGYSSRMGAFKPLLPIGDMTAIERLAEHGKAGGYYHWSYGLSGDCEPYMRKGF
jgi:CTP:molybdopterin cytidylyltransferase MocA